MADEIVEENVINGQRIRDRYLNTARQGDIEGFYSLIESHPQVLDEIESTSFVETPLHAAASAGKASFVYELMVLKRSFAQKLDKNGCTPLHLALREKGVVDRDLQNEHQVEGRPRRDPQMQPPAERSTGDIEEQESPENQKKALQKGLRDVLHILIAKDKNLIRIQGKGGLTPLHYAVEEGDLEILVDFLRVCPESVLDVNAKKETALHIALKSKQISAFQVLNRWLEGASAKEPLLWGVKLQDWKDKDDLSASQIKKEYLPQGRNPVPDEISNILSRESALSVPPDEIVPEENRSALLVVLALLLTLTFQTLLTPPGGTWAEDYQCPANDTYKCVDKPSHFAGTAIMGRGHFIALSVFNIISFLYLFLSLVSLLPRGPWRMAYAFPLPCLFAYLTISIVVTYPRSEVVPLQIVYPLTGMLFIALIIFLIKYFAQPLSGHRWSRSRTLFPRSRNG